MEGTFTSYNIIDQRNGKIVYQIMINDIVSDHELKLSETKDKMVYDHGIPYDMMYSEIRK